MTANEMVREDSRLRAIAEHERDKYRRGLELAANTFKLLAQAHREQGSEHLAVLFEKYEAETRAVLS